MAIDVGQFINTFLEESFEGLELIESQLLDLRDDDAEAVNAIFRAAHSIKGGAGTFGFQAVGDFTHGVETLLDQVRTGVRPVTDELKALLLEAGDCIRDMLVAARDGAQTDAARIARVQERIDASLRAPGKRPIPFPPSEGARELEADRRSLEEGASNVQSGSDEGVVADTTDPGLGLRGPGWRIRFVPDPDVMRTGNDPLRLFAVLADFGDLQVRCELEGLPPLAELDPEECRMSWLLTLVSDVNKTDVEEVFEWVLDECTLEVEALDTAQVGDIDPVANDEITPPSLPVGPASMASDHEAVASERARSVGGTACLETVPDAAEGTSLEARGVGGVAVAGRSTPLPERRSTDTGSIRVGIDKIDGLINLVGELVITQSMLGQIGDEMVSGEQACLERLLEGLAQLERNTRELQESVMNIRMLPISFVFNRFPRLVHDLSARLGKRIELRLSGEQTELDKTVMEKIGDPLVHLVRNAIDHGIELPQKRIAAGKPESGQLHLHAYHKGGNIVIEIRDDGAGLDPRRLIAKAVERGIVAPGQELTDEQAHELIFAAGFSTAEQVSDVSGRGVGMDVVRKNIKALGGSVEVRSRPGRGCTFVIRLPLTLAIMDGQLVRVGGEIYIVPLVSIVESLQVRPEAVHSLAERQLVYRLRDEYIPIVFLVELLADGRPPGSLASALLVVVEADGQKLALVVEDLLGQQQVVIKALETNFRRIEGLSGATILGDGTVALILDVSGLIGLCGGRREAAGEVAAGVDAA